MSDMNGGQSFFPDPWLSFIFLSIPAGEKCKQSFQTGGAAAAYQNFVSSSNTEGGSKSRSERRSASQSAALEKLKQVKIEDTLVSPHSASSADGGKGKRGFQEVHHHILLTPRADVLLREEEVRQSDQFLQKKIILETEIALMESMNAGNEYDPEILECKKKLLKVVKDRRAELLP